MNRIAIRELIAEQPAGLRGLLAHEILVKQGRRHGPIDGKCEVCGAEADSFTLQDWYRWHCFECVKRSLSA